jgi:hypothetical protein
MKTQKFQKPRLTIVALTLLALVAGGALAQDASTSTAAADATQPAAVSQAAPNLSYGVSDVLQLSQAKVGDSTIINYVRNSGNNYGLNAAQIIYLRQQGVSAAVINAMLDQHSQAAQTPSATTAPPAVDSNASSAPAATVVAQPTVTYVQTVPSSSVYIIPDTQTYYYNNWLYNHSPYYAYCPGYYWPYSTVSVSYIGGRGWVGYRGGYHGGWHSGSFHSGWHGGGAWHHR